MSPALMAKVRPLRAKSVDGGQKDRTTAAKAGPTAVATASVVLSVAAVAASRDSGTMSAAVANAAAL